MGKIVVTKQAWKQNYLGEIEKMDREQRVLLCMRVVIFGVSAVGFLYQLSLLMAIYWSDTTDVDNRVEHLRRSELPAITICLPTFLDMEKFAENYLKNSTNSTEKNIYLDYQKFKSEFKGECRVTKCSWILKTIIELTNNYIIVLKILGVLITSIKNKASKKSIPNDLEENIAEAL